MDKALDTRRLSPDSQEDLRNRAIAAVLSGKSQSEVARILHVSRQSVNTWLKKTKKNGKAGLVSKARGGRKPRLLKKTQEKKILSLIEDSHPEQYGLAFTLWTREAVQALILSQFGVHLAIRTIGDYLQRWKMTPQKPARRASEQDPQAVTRWMTESYPKIHTRAKKEKALIYWGDEMGLRSDHQAGRSYGKKGKTPLVRMSGNRFSSHMISGLNNVGKLHFSVFRGKFVTPVFLGFLKRLIQQEKRKVFLIVDGHPVHKAKAVSAWLDEHKDRIELFFLPGYSPELNPDELLNQDIKANIFKNKRPATKMELDAMLRAKLRSFQRQPSRIKSYFKHRLLSYISA